MSIIVDFLKNENVDIRVTTGNCIALLFEIAREISENVLFIEYQVFLKKYLG